MESGGQRFGKSRLESERKCHIQCSHVNSPSEKTMDHNTLKGQLIELE